MDSKLSNDKLLGEGAQRDSEMERCVDDVYIDPSLEIEKEFKDLCEKSSKEPFSYPRAVLVDAVFCYSCGRHRCLVDGLCDDCTLKRYGRLFPDIIKESL